MKTIPLNPISLHPRFRAGFLLLCLVLGLVSCNQEIDYDGPNSEPKLVVEAFASDQAPFSVELTRSQFFLENNFDSLYITDATVEYSFNGAAYEKAVYDAKSKCYLSSELCALDDQISLRITHPDYETVTSQTYVPHPVQTSSTMLLTYTDSVPAYSVTLFDTDLTSYYYLDGRLFVDKTEGATGQSITEEYELKFYSDDPIFDTEFDSYKQPNSTVLGLAFSDETFQNQERTIAFTLDSIPQYEDTTGQMQVTGVSYVLNVYAITEEYFLYRTSMDLYDAAGDSFFAEPVLIYSNIKNGYGICTGQAVTSTKLN